MAQNNSINNDQGFIGTGTPYFYPEDGSPVFFFGNPVTCKISASADEKVRQSRKKENAGAALDSKSTPKPTEVTIATDTFQPRTWAMGMMGTSAKVTTAAKAITGEAARAVFDGYHQLANTDIDESTVVVKKGATPIDRTKYSVNAMLGLLQITDAAAATAGDALTVDYATKQTTKTNIDGAKVTSFRGKLVIDGKNDVTGEPVIVTIHKLSVAVNGDFDFFSDDYNTIEMKGTAAVGDTGTPYTVELYE